MASLPQLFEHIKLASCNYGQAQLHHNSTITKYGTRHEPGFCRSPRTRLAGALLGQAYGHTAASPTMVALGYKRPENDLTQ